MQPLLLQATPPDTQERQSTDGRVDARSRQDAGEAAWRVVDRKDSSVGEGHACTTGTIHALYSPPRTWHQSGCRTARMRAGQGGRVRGGLSETLRIRALLTSLTRAPSKALPRFTALYGCTPCRNQFASCCSVQHSRGDSSTGARDWGRPDQPSETHLTTLDVDDFPHGFYSKESKVRSVEGGKEGNRPHPG